MSKFSLSFRSAKSYNALTDHGALPAWVKYLNEVVAPTSPIRDGGFEPATVVGEAGPSTQLGGYLIITADDLEAAVSIAKSCPDIEHGGGTEVGLLADLPPEHAAERMRSQRDRLLVAPPRRIRQPVGACRTRRLLPGTPRHRQPPTVAARRCLHH